MYESWGLRCPWFHTWPFDRKGGKRGMKGLNIKSYGTNMQKIISCPVSSTTLSAILQTEGKWSTGPCWPESDTSSKGQPFSPWDTSSQISPRFKVCIKPSYITTCFKNGQIESLPTFQPNATHKCGLLELYDHWVRPKRQDFRCPEGFRRNAGEERRVLGCANDGLKCGRIDGARNLFDKIPERNVVCWNSMIWGTLTMGRLEKRGSCLWQWLWGTALPSW